MLLINEYICFALRSSEKITASNSLQIILKCLQIENELTRSPILQIFTIIIKINNYLKEINKNKAGFDHFFYAYLEQSKFLLYDSQKACLRKSIFELKAIQILQAKL